MSSNSRNRAVKRATVATFAMAASLLGTELSFAAVEQDFSNPAIALSNQALVETGTCIARYAVELDDGSSPAAAVGRQVAAHCAKQISLSAGLASWMSGRPEDFSKNLQYGREDLTTNAVLRHRAASKPHQD
jgi:hypothetical protein